MTFIFRTASPEREIVVQADERRGVDLDPVADEEREPIAASPGRRSRGGALAKPRRLTKAGMDDEIRSGPREPMRKAGRRMDTHIRREERMLNLLTALLAARGPVPTTEILQRVAGYSDEAGLSARQKRLDRDKVALRELGVPLEFVPDDGFGRSGYRVARERFFLDEIRFTVEEGIVLAALQRALGEGDALSDDLRSALTKIGVDSPLSEALRESVSEQQLIDPRLSPGRREEGRRLAVMAEAVGSLRPLRFRYYTLGTGEERLRTVEPWGLGYAEGHWYLVGRDVDRREERVFRTDRVRGKVELLPASGYQIPPGFRLFERIGRKPWELKEGTGREVRIRFVPEVAWMIAENLRDGQSFASDPDGSGVLTLRATEPRALVGWVAQFGPDAEILSPPSLRKLLVEHLEVLIGRYPG
jgi:predicted DNA-binding transcriptional regulator YafY